MDPVLSLTARQSLMWIEDQLHPGQPLNNMVTLLALQRPIDVGAFQRAFARLVERHDAMRMTVRHLGERFAAQFHPVGDARGGVGLAFLDLSREAEPKRAYDDWLQARCGKVFQFGEPLYEATLIKLGDAQFVFFMNQHHCVTDGRTCQLLIDDLDRYYREEAHGLEASEQTASEEAERPSFCDHLTARQSYRSSEAAAESEAYWNERFATAPELISFYGQSTDLKRLSTLRHDLRLPMELAERIVAGKRTVPPSIFFIAVLFAFLRRMSGNGDICVGIPQLNRPKEHADTMGLFMDISLNRLQLDEDDSFASLLEKLRAETKSVKPHRGHPVVSRNARYEALLNFRLPAETRFDGAPARLRRLSPLALLDEIPNDAKPSEEWAGRDGLALDVTHDPVAKTFDLAFDFNEGTWPRAEGRERAIGHFLVLLRAFLDEPESQVDAVDLVGEEERAQLAAWSRNEVSLPEADSVLDLFEAQVARAPDATAVESGGEVYSYARLNDLAEKLGKALVREGFGTGATLGVQIERCLELPVALLGIMKSGAAFVPLDPSYPEQRRQVISEEARLDSVLTAERVRDLLADAEGDSEGTGTLTNRGPLAEQLCYAIFTSGSTGRPKGVMIEHRSFVNFIVAMQAVLQLAPSDRFLSVTNISFDIFYLELFVPLCHGACTIFCSAAAAQDGRALAGEIETSGATHMQATPVRWLMLLEAGWQADASLEGRSIKGLVGGELLNQSLADRLAPCLETLWNLYGPTEATIWATATEVAAKRYRAGDVGRPIPNYRVHVLDAWGREAPIGVTGEIHIGGEALARGYMNRPELTEQTFVDCGGLGRLYRTGDLGRWCADGHIEFLGRADYQIKLRGYRIELGEIEATLMRAEGVKRAVVATHGEAESKQLVAYIEPKESATADLSGLDEALFGLVKQSLPDYMMPAKFMMLERFPVTPNGKIDRRALPAPSLNTAGGRRRYHPPETPLQAAVAEVWAETLGLERVGICDSFFDLGGHSLLAMLLVVRMEQATGVAVPLIDLVQHRTIKEICDEYAAGQSGERERGSRCCTAIRASGSLPPFFAVGSHPKYVDVAARVDPSRAFYRLDLYALQSERLEQGLKLLNRIDDFARQLTDIIQSVQPEGPYFIGGGCEGAPTGYAIARELQRRGHEVARLILWITPAPGYGQGAVFGKRPARRFFKHLRSLINRLRLAHLNWPTLKEILRHETIEYNLFKAMDQYDGSQRFAGEIVLVRTGERRGPWDNDRALGWGGFTTGGVQVHDVPGDHDSWLVDHADGFGDLLDACLKTTASGTDVRK